MQATVDRCRSIAIVIQHRELRRITIWVDLQAVIAGSYEEDNTLGGIRPQAGSDRAESKGATDGFVIGRKQTSRLWKCKGRIMSTYLQYVSS
jgi:hypothetical protein